MKISSLFEKQGLKNEKNSETKRNEKKIKRAKKRNETKKKFRNETK
jgi:hypothetical protein